MPKPARVSFLLDRWESGVAGLSHHAEYIYFRCCQFLWGHGRAIKPNEIPAVCRFHPDAAAGIEELIEAGKLTRLADRSLVNGRAIEEHERAVAISEGARKANAIRWQSERMSERNPSPSPSPSPTTTPTPSPPVPGAQEISRPAHASNGRKRKEANGHSEPSESSPSSLAWQAYDLAYHARYGAPATRNARANSLVKQFCQRVPATEAPAILAHFLASNRSWYITKKHSLQCAVSDAEALRTEWLTGRHGTDTQARQTDRAANMGDIAATLIAEAKNGN